MQSALKELRSLKQEELTMMNLASKISDQLNRLKVEELALQNMVRLQNEEQELLARGSSGQTFGGWEGADMEENEELEEDEESMEDIEPLDLMVNNNVNGGTEDVEEEDEDSADEHQNQLVPAHDDIEQFVEQL